jgi:hypothetical protein
MSRLELVRYLEEHGVMLWVDGARLHFQAPPGVMTDAIMDALREHKSYLVALVVHRDPALVEVRPGLWLNLGLADWPFPRWEDLITPEMLTNAQTGNTSWSKVRTGRGPARSSRP